MISLSKLQSRDVPVCRSPGVKGSNICFLSAFWISQWPRHWSSDLPLWDLNIKWCKHVCREGAFFHVTFTFINQEWQIRSDLDRSQLTARMMQNHDLFLLNFTVEDVVYCCILLCSQSGRSQAFDALCQAGDMPFGQIFVAPEAILICTQKEYSSLTCDDLSVRTLPNTHTHFYTCVCKNVAIQNMGSGTISKWLKFSYQKVACFFTHSVGDHLQRNLLL